MLWKVWYNDLMNENLCNFPKAAGHIFSGRGVMKTTAAGGGCKEYS